jgi:hypothetical protein
LGSGRECSARRGSRLWRSRGVDAGAHQKKKIDEKNGDEDKAADEDVRAEAEHSLMLGKVGRRDVVVLVVALVMMFRHADKLTLQKGLLPRGGKIFWLQRWLRRLFVAAGAGHEFADGLFGTFVVVEYGVHLLGDRHFDGVTGGEAESGSGAEDAFGDSAVEAGDDIGKLAATA